MSYSEISSINSNYDTEICNDIILHPYQNNNSQVVPINNQIELSNLEQTSLSQNIDESFIIKCNGFYQTFDSNEIELFDMYTAIEDNNIINNNNNLVYYPDYLEPVGPTV